MRSNQIGVIQKADRARLVLAMAEQLKRIDAEFQLDVEVGKLTPTREKALSIERECWSDLLKRLEDSEYEIVFQTPPEGKPEYSLES